MLMTLNFSVALLFLSLARTGLGLEFKEITSDVFSNGRYSGMIAAFGDFNADKLTDLFSIKSGTKLEVLLSNSSQPLLGTTSLSCSFKNMITNVIPGDYNGDSMMDVLVSLEDGTSENVSVVVLWGSLNGINCSSEVLFNLSKQPFVLDFNDDMILDVMGDDEHNKRCIWISNVTKQFTKHHVLPDSQPLKVPHSSAVVDLNGDLVSDLVFTGINSIEVWLKKHSNFYLEYTIPYPRKSLVQGQLTFVDFNTNGELDILMAFCFDNECKSSKVGIWHKNSSWITLLDNFKHNEATWGFNVDGRNALDKAALSITLRSSDFNMDGYPDFVIPLENKDKSGETRAVVLENIPCSNCAFGRTLQIHWDTPGLVDIPNVQLVVFYDIFEDGVMDVLASSKSNGEWHVHVLKNMDTYDAYFIKVLVLSGLCYTSCPISKIPYGTNQPGPMIMYNTTKPNGDPLVSCAVQMPQSAYFPLHLPYTVFGLGQTPNFVDHLTVAIPETMKNSTHLREWSQIIPNSQMVVIPYPPHVPHRWVNKLFLTPSHLVFLTCVALVGTCAFIALIISILHWKERREDKKEKMQEAYRFPFDAM